MASAISTSELTKVFRKGLFSRKKEPVVALDSVTFDVKEGEVFGLLGPNGAGKTTLIRVLTGLIRPTSGRGSVFGLDCAKQSHEIRKRITLLPQEASCYENLTAKENIYYYGGIHATMDDKYLHRRTEELIDQVGLRGRENDLTKDFSGGMKRKVLVARSLVMDPDLIFMDEPTTGIDVLGARVIRNLVKNLSKELSKTFVLSTHDLTEVHELCDRVGIMVQGRMIIGTPDELEDKFRASGLEDVLIGLTTGEIDFE
ncbi:MAG: ABC transporter ATP-binding protein [Candidatus Odinarchaeota archaeon]